MGFHKISLICSHFLLFRFVFLKRSAAFFSVYRGLGFLVFNEEKFEPVLEWVNVNGAKYGKNLMFSFVGVHHSIAKGKFLNEISMLKGLFMH